MIIEIYLINNLKINIFFENDVFVSQKIKIDSINNEIIIKIYQNFVVNIDVVIKNVFKIY